MLQKRKQQNGESVSHNRNYALKTILREGGPLWEERLEGSEGLSREVMWEDTRGRGNIRATAPTCFRTRKQRAWLEGSELQEKVSSEPGQGLAPEPLVGGRHHLLGGRGALGGFWKQKWCHLVYFKGIYLLARSRSAGIEQRHSKKICWGPYSAHMAAVALLERAVEGERRGQLLELFLRHRVQDWNWAGPVLEGSPGDRCPGSEGSGALTSEQAAEGVDQRVWPDLSVRAGGVFQADRCECKRGEERFF